MAVAGVAVGALPRIRWGARGRGCDREGSGALPLERAAAVSTGLRVRQEVGEGGHADGADERLQRGDVSK